MIPNSAASESRRTLLLATRFGPCPSPCPPLASAPWQCAQFWMNWLCPAAIASGWPFRGFEPFCSALGACCPNAGRAKIRLAIPTAIKRFGNNGKGTERTSLKDIDRVAYQKPTVNVTVSFASPEVCRPPRRTEPAAPRSGVRPKALRKPVLKSLGSSYNRNPCYAILFPRPLPRCGSVRTRVFLS